MLLEGKKVFVGPFLKRTDRPADKEAHYTNIYVKNVAESVTEEQLEKMFAEHGKVRLLALVVPWQESAAMCSRLSLQPCIHIRNTALWLQLACCSAYWVCCELAPAVYAGDQLHDHEGRRGEVEGLWLCQL